MLINYNFDMMLTLPNITTITSSTKKIIHNVGPQIFGCFGLVKNIRMFERLKHQDHKYFFAFFRYC